MNDLVRWLGAQLDADERRERGKYVIHGSTVIKCPRCPEGAYSIACDSTDVTFDCGHAMDGEEFVETFGTPDPDEFVLADIAAKRRIINEGDDRYDGADEHWRVLALLALPYAGRDGYKERWRP